MEFKKFGGYRIGTNIPFQKGAVWENVARASRWGAPVIELNTDASRLGKHALNAIKQQAMANDLVYTWHVPPAAQQSGELAVPNDPNQNEFARLVMEQAVKSASKVGAKHITFHATHSAARPAKGTFYAYDVRQKQIGLQRNIEGLDKTKDNIKLLNDSAKAQLRTQINNTESQMDMVNNMRTVAKTILEKGVDDANSLMLSGIVGTITTQGSMTGIQPENYSAWHRIQNKVIHNQPLTSSEKNIITDYSKKVVSQVDNYAKLFDAQLKQLKPYEGKDLIVDGELEMRKNVARNIAKMDKRVLHKALKNGISLGFENLPGNQLFSTPRELNDLRDRTVKALVKSGKVNKSQAEQLIGFTFDFAHANTTKYFEINGKKFASPSQFVDQLKGPVKHVHATDSFGAVDGHLPLGQGELKREEFEKIKESLNRNGFRGTAVHELGASELPVLYGSSMEWVEGNNYMVGDVPTSSIWGPSYLAASMTDPLMLEKDKGYFYESFVDSIF